MNPKRGFRILLIAISMVAFTAPVSLTQGMGGGMGNGMGRRMYDPKTETTVNGAVEEVKPISGQGGMGGTHLDLKTESATVEVRVGPSHYVESKGFHFAKGDKVEVTGSKVTSHDHEAIIAREVKMGRQGSDPA